MIYQVKIDQAVLFTGQMDETIRFLQSYTRYRLEWLHVYGYNMGRKVLFFPMKSQQKTS